ncbi:GvpL/GvpF family gas vesicle protein [Ancylobacter dichloromethanicus]|uniref:Gas vesicle protein n=1 Tax=Ancylobacter dichloromethanicus TaxID=518825 RepID=A0A9W6J607_9HYPH|nr:GvpL/GvpF family gas vesicle protein [Ancylobacter dichloromethanicus]MBS7554278.1 GvpL/GvpF family gas vesicle protein [Ancylobacter dichloromethanicus]GLK71402.1 gas vesicle protein [Ancylobacter dichloromethanicus]
MLYLYAILELPPPTKPLPAGIGGVAPLFVTSRDLACAATETADTTISPEPSQIWRHQEVVAALMEGRPVLPLRFGTVVEDAGACQRLLARHHDALCAQLERVRHCVEFALRVAGLPEMADPALDPVSISTGSGPGATHLRTLARRERGWPASTETFPHEGLAAHAAEQLLWACSPSQPDLRASFLVRRQNASSFLDDVAVLQRLRPDLGVTVTGPWPPYSFSDPDLSGGSE